MLGLASTLTLNYSRTGSVKTHFCEDSDSKEQKKEAGPSLNYSESGIIKRNIKELFPCSAVLMFRNYITEVDMAFAESMFWT